MIFWKILVLPLFPGSVPLAGLEPRQYTENSVSKVTRHKVTTDVSFSMVVNTYMGEVLVDDPCSQTRPGYSLSSVTIPLASKIYSLTVLVSLSVAVCHVDPPSCKPPGPQTDWVLTSHRVLYPESPNFGRFKERLPH